MSSLAPVPGVVRVVCSGTAAGSQIVNVFHVRAGAGSLSGAVVAAATTAVGTAYQTNFVSRLSAGYSGGQLYGVDLTSEDGGEAFGVIGGTTGVGGTGIPNSACVCITWKIGRHYRGGHPRTYLGPLPTTAIESPTSLANAYVTSVRTGATSFLAAVNGTTTASGPCTLVCIHRQRDKVQLVTPLVSPILDAAVDDRIDSQRRRLGRDR